MDFGLTAEQQVLQETVRGWVANECPAPRLREIFDAGVGDDPELWRGISEMGLAGLIVPEQFGGAEMEVLDLALVMEVLGAGAVPSPLFGHSLACLALVRGGCETQKQEWLPRLASGELVGTYAVAEAGSRWEPADWNVEERAGAVSGVKLFVPHAERADLIVVGCSRGRLALVESGAEGVRSEDSDGIDRTRPIGKLVFDRVPAQLLDAGRDVSHQLRDAALVLLAADSFGAAWRLVQMSCEYAKTREQFGLPIAQFQSVKHQLARLATDIEPTRALYWFAAYAFDHLPEEAEHATALAKAHITDRAMETARQAVELHGGIGFTWECNVQIWFKRAMFNRAAFGTPEFLRGRIATLGGY